MDILCGLSILLDNERERGGLFLRGEEVWGEFLCFLGTELGLEFSSA